MWKFDSYQGQMDMMEFVTLDTSEIVSVIVLSVIVIAIAILGRRAQQQAPVSPGDAPLNTERRDESSKRRAR